MPLKGIKVLEFVGLAPGPFCGKILTDFGARVTRIDRLQDNALDVLQQGKDTLAIDIKNPKGQQLIHKLAKTHDVLIEPFRPGVMERYNIGPDVLCSVNPRLVYARLTGFGQSGPLAKRAGHDINYVALSGVLSMLGKAGDKPSTPVNLLADFAGGSLLCAMGICLALLERVRSNRGQVVDAAMVDGAAYVASWLFFSRSLPIWTGERGTNQLDGGAYFYDTYQTKDGKFMSVGALEPQFFEIFKKQLNLPHLQQFAATKEQTVKMRAQVAAAFLTKTQKEWSEIFEDLDACVYPVVEWQHVLEHAHHKERHSFIQYEAGPVPKPAPRLSRTPGQLKTQNRTEATMQALNELSLEQVDLQKLIDEAVIVLPTRLCKI